MAALRLIVGVSGAPGFVYGARLLQLLRLADEIATGIASSLLERRRRGAEGAAPPGAAAHARDAAEPGPSALHSQHRPRWARSSPARACCAKPQSLQMVDHTLGRVLDLFDIRRQRVAARRAGGSRPARQRRLTGDSSPCVMDLYGRCRLPMAAPVRAFTR
ncbi:MAG: hypothetical protein IT390_08885 [Nitrospira sp.]|nr:hypothetical protein [Nitrospira sp.]